MTLESVYFYLAMPTKRLYLILFKFALPRPRKIDILQLGFRLFSLYLDFGVKWLKEVLMNREAILVCIKWHKVFLYGRGVKKCIAVA